VFLVFFPGKGWFTCPMRCFQTEQCLLAGKPIPAKQAELVSKFISKPSNWIARFGRLIQGIHLEPDSLLYQVRACQENAGNQLFTYL